MKSMPLLRYPSCAEMAGGAPHRIHPPESIHREEILPRSDHWYYQRIKIQVTEKLITLKIEKKNHKCVSYL